ncbi:MAG: hypothetical protein AAF799_13180 [Myxococcota bacterium]
MLLGWLIVLAAVTLGWPSTTAFAEPADAPSDEEPTEQISPKAAKMGDVVSIRAKTALGKALVGADDDCSKIVLVLEHFPLSGVKPLSCNRETGLVNFRLERGENDAKQWQGLLGSPTSRSRNVSVGLGTGKSEVVLLGVRLDLVILPRTEWFLFLAFWVFITGLFAYAIKKTGLLLDPADPAEPGNDGRSSQDPQKRRPYSLSRFQMAFWLYIVSVAYVFLWTMLGEYNSLNEKILAVLAVSSGTSLGSNLLDNSRRDARNRDRDDLGKAQANLETEIAALTTTENTDGSSSAVGVSRAIKEGELERVRRKLAAVPRLRDVTRGFFHDILYDANGPSLGRIQMFAWTIILGGVFIWTTYTELAMPEFSATMLSLMTVSSGTFVATKGPSKSAASDDETPPAGGANGSGATS